MKRKLFFLLLLAVIISIITILMTNHLGVARIGTYMLCGFWATILGGITFGWMLFRKWKVDPASLMRLVSIFGFFVITLIVAQILLGIEAKIMGKLLPETNLFGEDFTFMNFSLLVGPMCVGFALYFLFKKGAEKNIARNFIFPLGIVCLLIAAVFFFLPNVVRDFKPVRQVGERASAALDRVADAENSDSAIAVAVNALPIEGETLEQKVASWLRFELDTIDRMEFHLLSGIGISAYDAEKKVRSGHINNEVVVKVYSHGKLHEYFLRCANGLVTRRFPKMTTEKKISETIIPITRNLKVHDLFPNNPGTFIIAPGESLCTYLSLSEALSLALQADLPTYVDDSACTKVKSVKQGLKAVKAGQKIITIVEPYTTFTE